MFKPLVTHFLQHITDQNNWSRQHLMPYAGKVLQFNIAFITSNLLILEDGSLNTAGETAQPDATVTIPPSLALRLLAKDEAAKMQIKVEGDTHLATETSKILQLMRWDIEEDLSKVIGDIPANTLAKTSSKVMNEVKKQTFNLADMLSEYWQEEKMILAKQRHVVQFNNHVDALRSDVERLEKRIKKYTEKHASDSEIKELETNISQESSMQ